LSQSTGYASIFDVAPYAFISAGGCTIISMTMPRKHVSINER